VFFHFFSLFLIAAPYATFLRKKIKIIFFLWGGWGLTEGQSPPRLIAGGRLANARRGASIINNVRMMGMIYDHYLHFVGDAHSGVRGGGEVSGGGTLYMKWRASNFLPVVASAKSASRQVETHTHLSLSPSKTLKKRRKYSEF
jgi:hypothetical protein